MCVYSTQASAYDLALKLGRSLYYLIVCDSI
jgi:hypothetical protein